MVEARCPICGKVFNIPEGRGRAMVETRFLHYKDACDLPSLGEIVRVDPALAIVDAVDEGEGDYPLLTVHLPSGRERVLVVGDERRVRDQKAARERFFG